MAVVATDLEWAYEPADFFEEPWSLDLDLGTLTLDNGTARLRLAAAADPVPLDLRERAHAQVAWVLDARLLLEGRPYSLRGPNITQHEEGGIRHTVALLEGDALKVGLGRVDVVITDAAGEVLRDTKAERLHNDRAFVCTLTRKAAGSPRLTSLLRSYKAAVSDPANALVHLYEIKDALSSTFGGDEAALQALGKPKEEWRELKRLANDEPLQEGRHRGKHTANIRPATPDELVTAKRIARLLIERFAETLP